MLCCRRRENRGTQVSFVILLRSRGSFPSSSSFVQSSIIKNSWNRSRKVFTQILNFNYSSNLNPASSHISNSWNSRISRKGTQHRRKSFWSRCISRGEVVPNHYETTSLDFFVSNFPLPDLSCVTAYVAWYKWQFVETLLTKLSSISQPQFCVQKCVFWVNNFAALCPFSLLILSTTTTVVCRKQDFYFEG